ncbi:helix-turn-helix domain-containing protein [Microscilla marina]|uniref:Helix-turn-helix domain protein n=1 Tax=Microscilla marina ATCC 23134 TaxID=313606 RepID=A1ZSG2_MICM2|nr:helix-turn-helix domain-containing protein [Microscilla marina]EAY26710.1 helix-turn-helix domain protein [Microscilla marina ATCC 23134]
MFFSKNLRYIREEKYKITQGALAEILGVSRSALSAYEDGRAEPRILLLIKIAQYFAVSIDEMVNVNFAEAEQAYVTRIEQLNKYITAHQIKINRVQTEHSTPKDYLELVPQKATAGYTQGFANPEYLNTLPKYKIPFLSKGKIYRAFEIDGDSMLPLQSGAIVIGEKIANWDDLTSGQTCVVVSKHEGIVLKKVYKRLFDYGKLLLKSENISYRPYEIEATEILELWKFVAHISHCFPTDAPDIEDIKFAFDRIEFQLNQTRLNLLGQASNELKE